MDRFLKSRIFMVLCVVLVGFLSFFIFQNKPLVESLDQEIGDLKERIDETRGKTEKLQSDLEYFKSDSYLEKQARLKLNLKRPGEEVAYIVRDDNIVASVSNDVEEKSFWEKLLKIFKRD